MMARTIPLPGTSTGTASSSPNPNLEVSRSNSSFAQCGEKRQTLYRIFPESSSGATSITAAGGVVPVTLVAINHNIKPTIVSIVVQAPKHTTRHPGSHPKPEAITQEQSSGQKFPGAGA